MVLTPSLTNNSCDSSGIASRALLSSGATTVTMIRGPVHSLCDQLGQPCLGDEYPVGVCRGTKLCRYRMFGQENRTLEILDPNITVAFTGGRILYAYQCQSLERGKGSAVNVEMPLAVCVT